MPAIAEKGGLERLIERGLICKAHCDPCRIFYSDNKILNVIANELCNLLEERDRREGIVDNPPEIIPEFVNVDQEKISRELGR